MFGYCYSQGTGEEVETERGHKASEHQTVFCSICKKPVQTLLLPAMKGYSSLALCVQPERQKNKKPYFLKLLYYSPRAASINDHKTAAFKQQICILSQSGDQKPESHGDSRGKWAPCLFQLLVAPEFFQAPRLGDAASMLPGLLTPLPCLPTCLLLVSLSHQSLDSGPILNSG